MGEIMNSPKWVKSGAQERVSISCPTCGTRHDSQLLETSHMSQLVNKPFNICDIEVSHLWTRDPTKISLRDPIKTIDIWNIRCISYKHLNMVYSWILQKIYEMTYSNKTRAICILWILELQIFMYIYICIRYAKHPTAHINLGKCYSTF